MTPRAVVAPVELFALVDEHGLVMTFASAAKLAAHLEGIETVVRDRSRVARYLLQEESQNGR
jgi:hypothetical protein